METTINGETFAQAIRDRFGSVTAFTEAAGVSRAYIYRVLGGELPSVERLAQFADLLGLTVDDLLVISGPKEAALATM